MQLKQFFGTFSLVYILTLFFLYTYANTCLSFLPFLIVLLILSWSLIEFKLQQRKCISSCLFTKNSLLYRFFTSPYLLTLFLTSYSIVLTTTVFLELLFFTKVIWIYLVFHTVFMVYLYNKLLNTLKPSVTPQMLKLVAREFSIKIGSLMLFILFSVVLYYSDTPEYIASSITQTQLNIAHSTIGSSCTIVDTLIQVKLYLYTNSYWALSNITGTLQNEYVKYILWVLFIITNSLSALGLSRVIAQIIYMIDKYFGVKR